MLVVQEKDDDLFVRTSKHIEANVDLGILFQQFPENVKQKYLELKRFLERSNYDNAKEYFGINSSTLLLNHGSYGAVPSIIREVQLEWLKAFDLNPVKFMSEHPDYVAYQILKLGEFLKLDPKDLVLVQNATTATMSILRSLSLTAGDTILVSSLLYHAVQRTLDHLQAEIGFQVMVVDIPLPTTQNTIVSIFKKFIEESQVKPKVAIIDHIASTSAIVLPVGELCALFRSYGIVSIVDGAHAVGSIDLDISRDQPDFYFSNCHKWLFSPIGSAFLYVSKEFQSASNPIVISHGYQYGFQSKFAFTATKDYSPLFCIEAGLLLHQSFPSLTRRNHELCISTAKFLAKLWNGYTLFSRDGVEDTKAIASMAVVVVPEICLKYPNHKPWHLAYSLHQQLLKNGIEIMCVSVNDQVAIRISVQVYTSPQDFVTLGKEVYRIVYDKEANSSSCSEYLQLNQLNQ